MTEPDDRELEQYLKGGSKLSQRYREAGGERAPPELDEAILAQARAAVTRKRRQGRPWFTGLALAASLVLAVNLGWNVYRSGEANKLELRELDGLEQKSVARPQKKEFVPEPPSSPPAPKQAQRAYAPPAPAPSSMPAPSPVPAPAESMPYASESAGADSSYSMGDKDDRLREERKAEAENQALALRQAEQRRDQAARAQAGPSVAAGAAAERSATVAEPAAAAPRAKAAPLSEAQKIDRLIGYIGSLQDAKFVRNGNEYAAPDAAAHLRLKREKAGDRVKTADDFIRYCASYSSVSGEAYLIKFADGRTRTAEDVLREELGRINAGG